MFTDDSYCFTICPKLFKVIVFRSMSVLPMSG